MSNRAFLDQMRSRRGRPVEFLLRDRRALSGVLEEVADDRLQVRDGDGRRHEVRVTEIASWEDRRQNPSPREKLLNA